MMRVLKIGFIMILLFLVQCSNSGKTCERKCQEKGSLCLLGINNANQATVGNMLLCEIYYADCSSGCNSSSSRSSSSGGSSRSSSSGSGSHSSGGGSSGGGGGSSGGSGGSSHEIFSDFH